MKCDHCRYFDEPYYKSGYKTCLVFGDETPEQYQSKDGEGCICNDEQLAKMYRKSLKDFAREYEIFVDWLERKQTSEGEGK